MNGRFRVRRIRRARGLRPVQRPVLRPMRRLLLGGSITVMLAIALTVAPSGPFGVINATPAHADDGDLRPRLDAACARIPAAENRLETAIGRLDAGASQRGSLSWFRAAVTRAESNNRPRVAADLQRRLDRLTERRATLDERRAQLDRLVTICAERTAQG